MANMAAEQRGSDSGRSRSEHDTRRTEDRRRRGAFAEDVPDSEAARNTRSRSGIPGTPRDSNTRGYSSSNNKPNRRDYPKDGAQNYGRTSAGFSRVWEDFLRDQEPRDQEPQVPKDSATREDPHRDQEPRTQEPQVPKDRPKDKRQRQDLKEP